MNALSSAKLIFALRTTAAALLAAYAAFVINLPQAATSMMTVFIVSQPLAGMVLSKSLFRVVGTVIGASAAVLFAALFAQTPELMVGAASLWIGACVAVSVLLRDAPAAYGALLSGYTVAIIAFPNVDAPQAVFLSALDRGAEICVGIVAATVLSQTLFPQTAAEALKRATGAAVASVAAFAADTLRGRPDRTQAMRDRRAMISAVLKLDGLRVHAAFDDAGVRLSNRRLRLLHGRLMNLLALVVSIHDRMEILREQFPDKVEALRPRLRQAADALEHRGDPQALAAARARLASALPDTEAMRGDRGLVVERVLLVRAMDLLDFAADVERLGEARGPAQALKDESADDVALARYRDPRLALVSGGVAAIALIVISVFWSASGWNAGAGAAVMVAVMTSLFAQQDDPAAAAGAFFKATVAATAIAAVYAFAVLPRIEGFETLAISFAPLLIGAGYAMTFPRFALLGLAVALGALNLINLTNVATHDFAAFANNALAQLVGIGVAAALLGTLRPIGASWPIARLVRGLHEDLAGAMAGRDVGRLAFEARMFDRIDGLMARLDLSDPDQLALEQGALAGVRVGLNALALRRVARTLPAPADQAVSDALAALTRHFRRLARGEASAVPLDRLDAALDAALDPRLGAREDADDLPIWIAALRGALARHPKLFGAPAPEGGAA
ncbi:fusaric acid transporter [Methylopila jiangsuensis]|uniref:Fusaric acid transporter n=1 Tax=Methylopila jiangsuensis TaxID=586230 RepID=A0A9W6JI45_9HYPH|nr:FUSC family protein [Methylopila jiangsuensis]MDR6285146.1 putative membrane protein YccC [Methylopila jiangsuensis]GLK77467.1 fusaric acid transporter [Methylopila jiangsuensis]